MRLVLTNLSQIPPGARVWVTMTSPPDFARRLSFGCCRRLAPTGSELGQITSGMADREAIFDRFGYRLRTMARPNPHVLLQGQPWGREDMVPLEDGDVLVCTCGRPGHRTRPGRCHLEVVAEWLRELPGLEVDLYPTVRVPPQMGLFTR